LDAAQGNFPTRIDTEKWGYQWQHKRKENGGDYKAYF